MTALDTHRWHIVITKYTRSSATAQGPLNALC